uniref:Uncharacterized protein n=1 Tax=Pipistrellus kuhlii TaxID=59472 RepID=A0A7J8A782_PIPKU|nr:hypothetical protein mPipKuh1_008817 [Pipistrellus kuhlii]
MTFHICQTILSLYQATCKTVEIQKRWVHTGHWETLNLLILLGSPQELDIPIGAHQTTPLAGHLCSGGLSWADGKLFKISRSSEALSVLSFFLSSHTCQTPMQSNYSCSFFIFLRQHLQLISCASNSVLVSATRT